MTLARSWMRAALLGLCIALPLPLLPARGAEPSPPVDSQVRFSSPGRHRASSVGVQGAFARRRSRSDRLRTVPYFEDTFVSGGKTYLYRMVGQNPKVSAGRTMVRDVIVPLRFVFADGQVFDASSTIRPLRRSPLFRPAPFTSGVTQYADAIPAGRILDLHARDELSCVAPPPHGHRDRRGPCAGGRWDDRHQPVWGGAWRDPRGVLRAADRAGRVEP